MLGGTTQETKIFQCNHSLLDELVQSFLLNRLKLDLRDGLKLALVVPKLHSVNKRSQLRGIISGALVVTTEILGQLLMVVEHHISHSVTTYNRV